MQELCARFNDPKITIKKLKNNYAQIHHPASYKIHLSGGCS